jgi:hypothetical protein
MSLLDKIPAMADDALNNLHANAVRLGESGSAAQRASAAKLLPALETEIANRKQAKRQRLVDAGKTRAKTKAAAVAAATAETQAS